jgi:hypothetical protein
MLELNDRARRRDKPMTGFFIIFGGITAFAGVIALVDWLGRRQHREHRGQER